MAEIPDTSPSVLDFLGEEIVRIVAPVSACMLLVVVLVSVLSSSSGGGFADLPTIATIFSSDGGDSGGDGSSIWDKIKDALFNSLAFVALVTLLTFALVLLFYLRCTRCLKFYMAFSAFVVLAFLGGEIWLLLLGRFDVPLDAVTYSLLLLNFAVVGVLAVFSSNKIPILVTQGYLVMIGVFVAYWFTLLPEWTTWALLVAMAVYDLAAVLLPGGPLRLLLELAISRDEELPALVYEARPVEPPRPGARRRFWRERRDLATNSSSNSANDAERIDLATDSSLNSTDGSERRDLAANYSLNSTIDGLTTPGEQLALPETTMIITEQGSSVPELTAPLIQQQPVRPAREEDFEGIGLSSSGAIKLGLGDFIFYSVLVGRAAMYDFMTVYACYLAIVAGLGITLLLLAFYHKALPALPVSIALGVVFYLLTRALLEVFVVQCSTNLLMF